MGLFRKKADADTTKADREHIVENSKAVDALLVLAEGNEDLIAELKNLQEVLKYLQPSGKSKVMDYDKLIKNKIGDLRIALTKSNGEMNSKVKELLKDVSLAIADRNVHL